MGVEMPPAWIYPLPQLEFQFILFKGRGRAVPCPLYRLNIDPTERVPIRVLHFAHRGEVDSASVVKIFS
jgi:hypothetical protein